MRYYLHENVIPNPFRVPGKNWWKRLLKQWPCIQVFAKWLLQRHFTHDSRDSPLNFEPTFGA